LVAGVLTHRAALDDLIHTHAPEWPIDQMAIIDHNILRLAIWDFAVAQTAPIKVVINEAVELAKLYGSDSAPRFINGVLGALAQREHEIVQHFAVSQLH
jgi:N utilization substance protein B